MSARNNLLGLIFLTAVLAFMVFAAKRMLFRPPAPDPIAELLEKGKPPAKPPQPKPSAAVPTPPSSAPSPTAPAPKSNGQAQGSAPAAGGAVASAKTEPLAAAKGAPTTATDHRPEDRRSEDRRSEDRRSEDRRSEDHRPQLRLESGARLWIRVTAFNRKPDGSFIFRGTLLQPVELANANQLDQGTELAGSGTVNDGHVTVLVNAFTVGGANYTLLQRNASGSNKRSGTGLAVELDPGKLLEVWLASSSVYRKTP
jgi:hypothetical protein